MTFLRLLTYIVLYPFYVIGLVLFGLALAVVYPILLVYLTVLALLEAE